jgi:alcohol dehydrogenase class IV
MTNFDQARTLLHQFKGDTYLHGLNVLPQVGLVTAQQGRKAVLIRNTFPGSEAFTRAIKDSLTASGVQLLGEAEGAAPNAPREDLFRIAEALIDLQPDVLISFGGGSTIDATKAAEVLRTLGGSIDDYFGTGLVSQVAASSGKKLAPHVAIQTASSSAAHLTKYSNITDVSTGQKKLIVDGAIVPPRPVFDYTVTFDAPISLTSDGALDGISHSLEVLYSAVGKPEYATVEAVAAECIRLIVNYLPQVLVNPRDSVGREALGLATDLGGYSIMLGGTNGAHLTSFSLVDLMSHGRACGMLNPYYTVFFAPAVTAPLRVVGQIYRDAGYTRADIAQRADAIWASPWPKR